MSFKTDMERISKRINASVEETAGAVKFEALRSVVEGTRVDTGRAKGSWNVTQDTPLSGDPVRLDPTGRKTISEEGEKIEPIGLTFITSNLPYMGKLEELDGMVVKTVSRIRRILRDA